MDNDNTVSLTFQNKVQQLNKLEKYAEVLERIKAATSSIDKGKMQEVTNYAKETNKMERNLAKANKTAKEAKETYKNIFDTAKVTVFLNAIKKVASALASVTKKSAEQTENMNLLGVAFEKQGVDINETAEQAKNYVNSLADMYNLDESGLTRQVGLFKQMANSMGFTDEAGTKLSKTLTQLSIDVSSLYNASSVGAAAQVFQSALAGQTKPVRGLTGADITQQTLQVTMDSYGIDRTVQELSYAEKRLLIVTSLIQQLDRASNDFGRTIESPANQMKIFSEQCIRAGRAIGNFFMPIMAKVLPYLNAFLMVITEIVNWLAKLVAGLFGYDLDEAFLSGYDDSVLDLQDDMAGLGSTMDDATKSAKELKKGLRGFDELNVITTPTDSGKDTGAGGLGAIDPAIMNAFDKAIANYTQKLDKIKSKAAEIRDRIMEWLGFVKDADDQTWHFGHVTLGTVLATLGGIAVGFKAFSTLYGILKKFGLLDFSKTFGFITWFATNTGLSKAFESIGIAVSGVAKGFWTWGEALELIVPALGTIATVIGGVGIAIGGLFVVVDGINRIIDGDKIKGIAETIGGIALVVTGVAVAFGLWPVAIGGAIVAAIALIVAFWDEICDFFVKIGDWVYTNMFKPVIDFFTPLANWINDKLIKPVINFFTPVVQAIVEFFTYVKDKIVEIATGVGTAVKTIYDKIKEIFLKIVEIFVALGKAGYDYAIKPIAEWIGKGLKYVYDKFISPVIEYFKRVGTMFYANTIQPIIEKITWLRDKAISIFKAISTTVVDFISGQIKGVINGVLALIENNINSFIRLLNGAINIINKIPGVDISRVNLLKVPRLQKGLDFVPKDYYPAYLDYGERVLTKQENENYSKGIINGQQATQTPVNATFIIQVGDKQIAKTVLKDLQDMSKNNGKPITIG